MGQYLDLLKQRHSRTKCMDGPEPPDIEILWAEGMAHAWFCDRHFNQWKKENPGEISSERKLKYGVASERWKDGPPTKKESESIQKQSLLGGTIGSIDGDIGSFKPKISNPFSVDDKRKYKSLEELSELIKQDGGEGAGEGGYMTTESNIFTPTFGQSGRKKYKALEELLKQHTIPQTVRDRPRVARTSWTHADRSNLVRRMVRVKRADGSSYFSTRWVKPEQTKTGKSKKTGDMLVGGKGKEEKKEYDGGVVVLIPPQKIKDKLYLEGGEEKDEMHVTLAYLPFPWNTDVTELAKELPYPDITGKLTGKIERFGTREDEDSAVVATVIVPGIDKWREMFIPKAKERGLEVDETFPVFRAHITLKYIGKDEPLPIENIEPTTFNFDRMEVWEEEKKKVVVDFAKKREIEKVAYDVKTMSLDDKIKWWKSYKPQLIEKGDEEFIKELILQLKNG